MISNERIDDLQYRGLKLIQNPSYFCFGIDAVLLSDFIDIKEGQTLVDLGTGTGIIPILLAAKTQVKEIKALEIQAQMVDLAKRNVRLNNFEYKIEIVEGDLKEVEKHFKSKSFDVVVTNPPYMPKGKGLVNPERTKAVSKHELLCTLEDIIKASNFLLKHSGQLAMVHRPGRLVDILSLMRKYGVEPKYLRFVYSKKHSKSDLVLIKGVKGAKAELKMLEPIYIYNEDGNYSDEIDRIYSRGKYNES